MLETILPKKDFVNYIEHIKNVMAYQEGFNKLLDKHNVVGYFYSNPYPHFLHERPGTGNV